MVTPKKQRIVVTGGNGFIGTFLIQSLLNKKYKNIINVSRTGNNLNKKVKNIRCDIAKNRASLESIILKDDIVIHLAWFGIVSTSEIHKKEAAENNLLGSLNLLEVCAKKRIKKIIFLSSGGTVYGDSKRAPSKESDECHPKSFYGLLKLVVEQHIELFNHLYGLKYTILRVGNPYGRTITSGESRWAADIFLENAFRDRPIIINGDGSTVRDYIDIQDVLSFIEKAIKKSGIIGTYNIGTGVGTSLRRLISIIETISEKRLIKKYNNKNKDDLDYNVLNIAKALKTGWKPKQGLAEGLQKLYKNKRHG